MPNRVNLNGHLLHLRDVVSTVIARLRPVSTRTMNCTVPYFNPAVLAASILRTSFLLIYPFACNIPPSHFRLGPRGAQISSEPNSSVRHIRYHLSSIRPRPHESPCVCRNETQIIVSAKLSVRPIYDRSERLSRAKSISTRAEFLPTASRRG